MPLYRVLFQETVESFLYRLERRGKTPPPEPVPPPAAATAAAAGVEEAAAAARLAQLAQCVNAEAR